MSVNHEADRGSRSPSAAEKLIERLTAAGVPARLETAGAGAQPVSIHVPRSERDRARAIAIRAGLKALRIESRPETRSDEILIATDGDGGTLAPVCLRFDFGREPIPSAIANADLSSGGICIAISGGDGAGKSTAIAMLHNWLHPTFRLQVLHFGRPKPRLLSSLFYRFLGILRRLRVHVPEPMAVSEGGGARLGFLAKLVLVPQLLCLARDRRRTYRESRIAVGSGLIVLCDRYRDSRISDMEGPRLQNLWLVPDRWQDTLIRLEKSCYVTGR